MSQIKVVKYIWHRHACYLGVMNFSDVVQNVDSRTNLSMNREIDEGRTRDIVKYLENNELKSFFPPVILNSLEELSYNPQDGTLTLPEREQFSIIDGQHRLQAIKQFCSSNSDYEFVGSPGVPFLLIEGLSSGMHRDIFYKINTNAKRPTNSVSERFSLKVSNLLGLKYVAEHLEVKELIEWESNNSDDRIIYGSMTRCNGMLETKALDQLIDKSLLQQPVYRDQNYYSIFELFWNKVFNHINNEDVEEESKSFWVKVVVQLAVMSGVVSEVKKLEKNETSEESIDQTINRIKEKMTQTLDRMLLTKLLIPINLNKRQTADNYNAILDYINVNIKLLSNDHIKLPDNLSSKVKKLITWYLDKNCYKEARFNVDNHDNLEKFLIHVTDNYDAIDVLGDDLELTKYINTNLEEFFPRYYPKSGNVDPVAYEELAVTTEEKGETHISE